jgi:hypothetical protein
MEPTNMSGKHSDSNADLPSRVHGGDRAAANEHLPRSIWQPGVVQRLADYIKHLRKVDQQSNEPNVAGQPNQRHVCTRNPHYSCLCARGVCANDDATYRHARGPYLPVNPSTSTSTSVRTPKPNEFGNFRCPISGQLCSESVCREWCSGS